MTLATLPIADGVAPLLEPESFAVFAFAEIEAAPYWTVGRCHFPDCSADFETTRTGQKYCCYSCRHRDKAEARKWGHKTAVASQVWHQLRHSRDPLEQALCRKARSYVTHVQSAWKASRAARVAVARAGGGAV